MKIIFFFSVLSFVQLLSICRLNENRSYPAQTNKYSQDEKEEISFDGIRFALDKRLRAKVYPVKETETEILIKNEKPNYVYGTQVRFEFGGEYAKKFLNSFFMPEIRIIDVERYLKSVELSPEESKRVHKELKWLETLLNQEKLHEGKLPLVPFVDATQMFHTSLRYGSFSNWKFLSFVAYYSSEPVADNLGLAFIFEGLSTDGKYLVVGTFPLSISEGSIKPETSIEALKQLLENEGDTAFEPNIVLLRELTNSLSISKRS